MVPAASAVALATGDDGASLINNIEWHTHSLCYYCCSHDVIMKIDRVKFNISSTGAVVSALLAQKNENNYDQHHWRGGHATSALRHYV